MAPSTLSFHVRHSIRHGHWFNLQHDARFFMRRMSDRIFWDRRHIHLYFKRREYGYVLDVLERRAHPFSTAPSLN